MQHDLLGKTKSMIIWLYISRRKIWEVEAESKKEIFDRGLRVQHDHWFQHYNVTELATSKYKKITVKQNHIIFHHIVAFSCIQVQTGAHSNDSLTKENFK
jgi:hypothetical protein